MLFQALDGADHHAGLGFDLPERFPAVQVDGLDRLGWQPDVELFGGHRLKLFAVLVGARGVVSHLGDDGLSNSPSAFLREIHDPNNAVG